MNRKRITVVAIVALLFCLLIFLQMRTRSSGVAAQPHGGIPAGVSNQPAIRDFHKGTNTVYLTNLPPELAAKIKHLAQVQRETQHAEKAAAWVSQKNGRIDFWGLVVDQDDIPMKGVELAMHVRQWGLGLGLGAKFPSFTKVTDTAGRFALLDTAGDGLTIDEVRAPGYRWSPEAQNGSKFFPYHGMSRTFTPDPNNPVVIRMWRLKGASALIHYDHVGGPFLPVDGSPIYIDLIAGKRVEQGGHLELRLVRDPQDAWGNKRNGFSWRTEISVPGGGLQWREDFFGYEAPADGYVPKLVMGQEASDPAWKSRVQGQFYFRTAEGYYGRIEFQQNTDSQPPPCPFYVTCYLNPSGSRNLEYEYKLRIDPRKLVASNPSESPPQPIRSPNSVQPIQAPRANAPFIAQPPPGFQALTNRGKAFAPPVPPRP